jgi:thiosulfate reductase cytochrome b subunit
MSSKTIHPLWLRLTHWINAAAVIVLVLSGWQIYNAAPLYGFRFPSSVTIGAWLGGALLWHFAAMWVLACNGLLYLTTNLLSGRLWQRFFPLRVGDLLRDFTAALKGKLMHEDPRRYNAVQKLAYLFVIVATIVVIASGLVVWKSVQFPHLRELFGGYNSARVVHFFAMASLVAFFIVHVVMVALVPSTFLHITRGR